MKPNRNEPCPCGSGKKYKHCCESKQARASLPVTELNQLGMLLNAGRLTEVEARANTLLASHPREGGLWKLLSIAMQMQGKDGLSAFQKTTELLPNDAGAQMNLGHALQYAGQLEEAVLSYQRAIQIKPTFAEAHNNLGSVFAALGQLKNAAESYRRAVQIKPDFADAHINLGLICRDLGQFDSAIGSFHRALTLQPNNADTLNALGLTLHDSGKFDEAIKNYRKVLAINPHHAAAHNNFGLTLHALGQYENAAASCREAISLQPDFAEAHNNLGNALSDAGRTEEAWLCYQKALAIKPDFAEAHNNVGLILQKQTRPLEALASFRRAVGINPNYAAAYSNMSLSLFALGQYDDAAISCRRAIEINLNYAEAFNHLGNALNALGQFQDALASFYRAVEIKPEFAEAYSNIGFALHDLGQLDEAITNYRRALEIAPNYVEAHNNLGNTLIKLGQFDEALASYHRVLALKPDYFAAHSNLLFGLNYNTNFSLSAYLQEALHYGASVARKVTARFTAWQCDSHPQRLRVGVVSGDMWNHPVGYFIEDLLAQLDNTRIELIAYTNSPSEDDLTLRIKPHFAHWREIYALNDPAAAGLIHSDGVHILIDLSGHTSHNRLPVFAWKPAPVQCTWLGLPTTTGVAEIDYILGDPIATPPEDAAHFSEQIWRLPESYLCLSTPDATLQVNALPALTNGHPTFASFNNLSKMNDATVSLWARILIALPEAKLLLKAKQLKDPTVIRTTLQRFAAHGIATERLILEGQTPRRDNHLATYWRADIALDPFPYPGVTTSVEALWMGVPVLTLQGDRFMSRTAASILHNAGLPDWIARDEADYVAKAIRFAGDLPKLSALRNQLREQVRTSPLFDAPRFAKHFEAALWGMWQDKAASRQTATPVPA